MPGFGDDGPPPPGAGSPSVAPNPNVPVTHAASGGEELGVLPSMEASIPELPLSISRSMKKLIGTDADSSVDFGQIGGTRTRWYGPYYEETGARYRFRTVFPLWFERSQPNDTASMYSPLYFRRRSTEEDADVVFPLLWNVRNGESRTRVVGPIAWRRAPGEADNWLAPLLFQGSTKHGSYFHIPPLLAFTKHTATSGTNVVGPGFCTWEGGSSCSLRSAKKIDYGIAPFYFYGRSETKEYEVIPPLLHYYRYNDIGERSTNVWGPLVWKHDRNRNAFNILPLFYRSWGEDEEHVTVLPLFHYGHKGQSSLFVNPLFLSAKGDHGERTFVTWGYARYRGRTHVDMVTPLYWRYVDPDIGQTSHLLFPFLYSSRSPRDNDLALFPFWAHFDRRGIKTTTWVTPLFQHSSGITGWETNIHPLLYAGRYQDRSHLVLFPFFWDFASPRSRATVAFPLFWRFDDNNSTSQLLLNAYYHERKLRSGNNWQFHFFPAFSVGETPNGHWWKILYGLAGYERRGDTTMIRAAWVPITISGTKQE